MTPNPTATPLDPAVPTDQDLATQALAGNRAAAQALLMRHDAMLRKLAKHRIRRSFNGEVDANDVMQEFYAKVCSRGYLVLAQWQGLTDPEVESIAPYFRTVLSNVFTDQERSSRGRREREQDTDPPDLEWFPDDAPGVEREVIGRLRWEAVRAHIENQLAPAQREVIRLHLEGRDAAEIAAALGINPGAVRTRLSRALGEVRRHFERSE